MAIKRTTTIAMELATGLSLIELTIQLCGDLGPLFDCIFGFIRSPTVEIIALPGLWA
jgi:hypothetical protein